MFCLFLIVGIRLDWAINDTLELDLIRDFPEIFNKIAYFSRIDNSKYKWAYFTDLAFNPKVIVQ